MKFYPAFLKLEGRPCLVFGGGTIAERKVEALLASGAVVTVISPTLTKGLSALREYGCIAWRQRRYERGDLKGFVLAISATGDEPADATIAAEAEREGVLLNVVDRPRLCSFISPALVDRGDLTIAISTGGASPALARGIREELEQRFGPEYALALEILRAVRLRLAQEARPPSERREILSRLARSNLLESLRNGRSAEVDQLLGSTVGSGTSVANLGISLDA
jgi:precorrin-2 dehydrogenase/sirohydrochlorin ferrochelatase